MSKHLMTHMFTSQFLLINILDEVNAKSRIMISEKCGSLRVVNMREMIMSSVRGLFDRPPMRTRCLLRGLVDSPFKSPASCVLF